MMENDMKASSRFAMQDTDKSLDMKRLSDRERPFSKINFIMMGVCLFMIVLGFILMSGPGSSVEGGFNPDIFSTRRIVVGPAVSFLGFLLMAFAIVWGGPGKNRKSTEIKE